MTILERCEQREARKVACKRPRPRFRRPTVPVPSLSSRKISRAWLPPGIRRLLPKDPRKLYMTTPCPDVFVMRQILTTVQSLLRQKSSCTLVELANALISSDRIYDLYTSSTDENSPLKSSSRSKDDCISKMERLTESVRSWGIGKNDNVGKAEKNRRLKRQYELTNALDKLKNKPGSASTIIIRTWEEAKAHLETVLDLSELSLDRPEETNEDDSIDKERRDKMKFISQESSSRSHIGLSAAQVRFQTISQSHSLPRALADPIQAQIDARYHERAEKDRLREEHIRHIEEQVKQKEREEEAKKRATELMREMTDAEKAIVKKALYEIGSSTEIVAKVGTDTCQRVSVQRLRPGEWLNDEVIHYFLIMLALRDEQMVNDGLRPLRSHFFKSYFITKLLNEGDAEKDGMYEYKNVKRWSKNVPGMCTTMRVFVGHTLQCSLSNLPHLCTGKDIFKLDKIFFPVNVGQTHWTVVVAFMQQKRIQFYDSFGDSGRDWMEHVFQYIKDEHMDKKKSPLPDEDEWQLIPCVRGTPRQLNGTCVLVF